jgi:hypothetical protein
MYPGGIVFYQTPNLHRCHDFYSQRLGFDLWLDQGSCRILRRHNLLLGFIQGESTQGDGIITLFYRDQNEVDKAYEDLRDLADAAPRNHPKFRIYQFFANDCDGRLLEFQAFNHPIDWP